MPAFRIQMPSSIQHLLLCATHRTGSTLLQQYLTASRVAGQSWEYYSPEMAKELARQEELPDPDKHFLSYHRKTIDRWTTANGVFAAKIMWPHLQEVQTRLASDPEGAAMVRPTPWETLLLLHPNPLVVHVSRRDKVRQAISMVRAKQTGRYTSAEEDDGRIDASTLGQYDYAAIHYYVGKFTAEDEEWVNLFRRHQVKAERIVFEEFIADPQGRTIGLLKALNLPEPTAWHWPGRGLRKQSDATSEEWYARYMEDSKNSEAIGAQQRGRRDKVTAISRTKRILEIFRRQHADGLGRYIALQDFGAVPLYVLTLSGNPRLPERLAALATHRKLEDLPRDTKQHGEFDVLLAGWSHREGPQDELAGKLSTLPFRKLFCLAGPTMLRLIPEKLSWQNRLRGRLALWLAYWRTTRYPIGMWKDSPKDTCHAKLPEGVADADYMLWDKDKPLLSPNMPLRALSNDTTGAYCVRNGKVYIPKAIGSRPGKFWGCDRREFARHLQLAMERLGFPMDWRHPVLASMDGQGMPLTYHTTRTLQLKANYPASSLSVCLEGNNALHLLEPAPHGTSAPTEEGTPMAEGTFSVDTRTLFFRLPESENPDRMNCLVRVGVLESFVAGLRKRNLLPSRFVCRWEDCSMVLEPGISRLGSLIGTLASHSQKTPRPSETGKSVALVVWSLSAGGAERQIINIATSLARRGVRVTILIMSNLQGKNAHYLPEGGLEGVVLREASRLSGSGTEWLSTIREDSVLAELISNLPGFLAEQTLNLYAALHRIRPDSVFSLLDSANICGSLAALMLGVPRITMSFRNSNPSEIGALHQPYYLPLYRALLGTGLMTLTANSRYAAKSYINWVGLNHRVHIIRNLLAPEVFRTAEHDYRPGETLTIIGIFRLTEQKRPFFFLQIAAEIKKLAGGRVRFLHLGSGKLEESFRQQVVDLGLTDCFTMVGNIREVYPVLRQCSLLLHTSLHEGLPNVVLEAQALGVPVVASMAGGTPEALNPGISGVLCPTKSVEAHVQACMKILNDAELRSRMSEAAKQFIASNFDPYVHLETFCKLLVEEITTE